MGKRGLVLEGGGAKGAFHCGAVMALYENGYTFDGVAGTSIGAINAALIVQDGGVESMRNLWSTIDASMFTDFDVNQVNNLLYKRLSKRTVAYWAKQVLKIIKNAGIPTDRLLEFLQNIIDEKMIRQSDMDLAIVTYNLTDRMPVEVYKEDIPFGDLHNYILASAYYPAFRLKKIKGKFYIDGGIYDNMPVELLANHGYDDIFAIRTMSKMPHRANVKDDVYVRYICPSEDLGKIIDIGREELDWKMKLGYYDAMRLIKGYYGKRFYFSRSLDTIVRISERILHNLALRICEKADISVKDKTITADADKVNAFLMFAYGKELEDSIIDFLEEYGMRVGMEKFKVYHQPYDFLIEIRNRSGDYIRSLEGKSYRGTGARTERKKDILFSIFITEGGLR